MWIFKVSGGAWCGWGVEGICNAVQVCTVEQQTKR